MLQLVFILVSLGDMKGGQSEKHHQELLRKCRRGMRAETQTRATRLRVHEKLDGTFDREHGGFGSQPKFPTCHSLSFLLVTITESNVRPGNGEDPSRNSARSTTKSDWVSTAIRRMPNGWLHTLRRCFTIRPSLPSPISNAIRLPETIRTLAPVGTP